MQSRARRSAKPFCPAVAICALALVASAEIVNKELTLFINTFRRDYFSDRLHIACQKGCKRMLICGHECESKCLKMCCPPCEKPCETACGHSQCTAGLTLPGERGPLKQRQKFGGEKSKGKQQQKRKCGDPCPPCAEPCLNRCEHRQCSKLCWMPCDVLPCDEPCRKPLKCSPKLEEEEGFVGRYINITVVEPFPLDRLFLFFLPFLFCE